MKCSTTRKNSLREPTELKKLEEEERLKELGEGITSVKDTGVMMIWIFPLQKVAYP